MLTKIKDFFLKDILLEIKDLKSLHKLSGMYENYLPWSGASIRPTALVYVLNDIVIHNRQVIVECGSGISTIYIASLLKQLGQKERALYSIDQDESWLSILQNELKRNNLEEYVTLIHAPLKSTHHAVNEDLEWYDTDAIDQQIKERKIDLLLVDGPPANRKGLEHSRYPALPFFHSRMSDRAAIMLDDADRKGEQYVASQWKEIIGEPFKKCIMKGNLFICNRGDSYNVM